MHTIHRIEGRDKSDEPSASGESGLPTVKAVGSPLTTLAVAWLLAALPGGLSAQHATGADPEAAPTEAVEALGAVEAVERPAPVTTPVRHGERAATVLTGSVVDALSGRPVASARVLVPALDRAALTRADGTFILPGVAPGSYRVRIEAHGYLPAMGRIRVGAGDPGPPVLGLTPSGAPPAGDRPEGREVVLAGTEYGRGIPREKLTYTVERVAADELAVPSPSVLGMLRGRLPGVRTVPGDGHPGTAPGVMLRGPTTFTGSQAPALVVDGVITDGELADIPSLDIESIEIVKGPAAASLHGFRAQNGAVLIRTRRGAGPGPDRTRLTVRTEMGAGQLAHELPLAALHPFARDGSGAIVDGAGRPVDLTTAFGGQEAGRPALDGTPATAFQDNPYPSGLRLFDQLDRFFDPGLFLQSHVAVEGRTGATGYRASFTRQDREGVVPDFTDGFELNAFRLNLDHAVSDELAVSLSAFHSDAHEDEVSGHTFLGLTSMAPYADLEARDPATAGAPGCPSDGCFRAEPDPLSPTTNPLHTLQLADQRDERERFLGAVRAVWSPRSWFELEGDLAVDRSTFFRTGLPPVEFQNDRLGTGLVSRVDRSVESDGLNSSVTASFDRSFGDLTARARLRWLFEDQRSETLVVGTADPRVPGPVVDGGETVFDLGSGTVDIVSEGYLGGVSLDFRDRYLVDALVRWEGSSLFEDENRWQTYFRVSGAWRMAEEPWWSADDVQELKLRFSVGTAGGRPAFLAPLRPFSLTRTGLHGPLFPNPRLEPERVTERELGLEARLFERFSAGVTVAWSELEDPLRLVLLPRLIGRSAQWQNGARSDEPFRSNTVEAYVEAPLVERPGFRWSTRLGFDRTSQVIEATGFPHRSADVGLAPGEELGTFFGNAWVRSCSDLPDGTDCSRFQVNDDGLLVWVGAGNSFRDGVSKGLWGTEGEVDGATYRWGRPIQARDRNNGSPRFVALGNGSPDARLSWANTVRWGPFDLYALVDGELGADVYNQTRQWAYRDRRSADLDQAGKPAGLKKPVAYYEDLYDANGPNGWFVEDGSFVKLREASLRYSVDPARVDRWLGAVGADGLSLIVAGRNLLTFTGYSGYDPEVGIRAAGAGGSEALARVDDFGYPTFREVTATVQVVF